jgi:hypothetical protein
MPHALFKPVASTAAALIASGIATTGFISGGPAYADTAGSPGPTATERLSSPELHWLAGHRRLAIAAAEHREALAWAAEVRAAKVRAAKVRAAKVRAAKVRAAKVRAAKARAAKARAAKARAAKARAARVARARSVARSSSGSVSSSGDPRSTARALMSRYGFAASQFGCLNSLWVKESGWNYRATNPSSGAYGIPQSLPATKMASAGGDWRTNPTTQIRWGLNYIQDRYGSPCAAWAHSQRTNWY